MVNILHVKFVQLHLTWESQGIWWEERVRILTDFITSCGPVVQWVACHLSGFSVGEKRGKDLDYHNSPLSWLALGGQGEDVRACVFPKCVFVCGFGAQLEIQNNLRFLCNVMSICSRFWRWLHRKVSIHNFALHSLTNDMCLSLSKMPQHQVAEEVRTSEIPLKWYVTHPKLLGNQRFNSNISCCDVTWSRNISAKLPDSPFLWLAILRWGSHKHLS